ncbi:MAG: phospholipase D family protein [Opitutaceae bacterium]|nr:phospholipase D family protein [Opitutaceae bacterium]
MFRPSVVRRIRLLLLLCLAPLAARAGPETAFAGTPFGPAVAAAFAAADGKAADGKATDRGNRLALLGGGYDALLLRVHLIRQARVSIAVQTFIWTNDECGRLLMYELIEAARRGVKVRVIADHLVSDQDPEVVAFLATAHPNFELKHYRPAMARIKPSLFHTLLASVQSFHGVNQRMHNKVMLFDDAVLITGGRNIENTYYDHATEMNFRDRDVVAVGPVARAAAESFAEFWKFRHAVSSRDLTDVQEVLRRGGVRRYDRREDYDFGGYFEALDREADDAALVAARFADRLRPVERVVFVSDEPGKSGGFFSRTARITRELGRTLERARGSVVMQTPYLVLSPTARQLFRELQERHPGLRIRISSNSFASTDNLLAYSANYRLRNEYVVGLKLQVHEFKPRPAAMAELFPRHEEMAARAEARIASGRQERRPFLCLHAKSLVVDDAVAFVGSYNLDPRSENLNTEVGLLVEDAAFARELREEIERDMRPENSWVIARRSIPLGLETVNALVGGVLALGPLEVWPIQNTSSFELRPGAMAVPPDAPDFHQHYREAGSFPGTDTPLSNKEILTRLYKAVGAPLTPVL